MLEKYCFPRGNRP